MRGPMVFGNLTTQTPATRDGRLMTHLGYSVWIDSITFGNVWLTFQILINSALYLFLSTAWTSEGTEMETLS